MRKKQYIRRRHKYFVLLILEIIGTWFLTVLKIGYEPWHYRYVGRKAAKEMKKNNMCLEEYIKHVSGGNV